MLRKYIYIVITVLFLVGQVNAQIRPGGSNSNRQMGSDLGSNPDSKKTSKDEPKKKKPKIPSRIKTWEVHEQGSLIQKSDLDTVLTFYHVYEPYYKNSISSTFTGNNGGAYITNDFFKRTYSSDFYFAHSFDAYMITPSQIQYFNTTTPYSILDYTQSENSMTKNETRFNAFLSQNAGKKLNFEFIYNQTGSQGQYINQINKFHTIGLVSSYNSDNFISHSNIIFNRLKGQENGGIDPNQPFSVTKTEDLTTQIDDAAFKVENNNLYTVNEYRLGKTTS